MDRETRDAGLIRCEAPGASQNKTATLLVKCPPEFTDPNLKTLQVNNDTADVTFIVRTHTTMFQYCSVTMAESGGNVPANGTSVTTSLSAEGNFTCSSLTGTPPDLTLTVSMKSIKKQDEGTWRLELANDVGTDHLDFVLAVTESE
nr:hypothetical protein BaRGS_015780 [Batillaria attramentaria]